VIDHGVWATTLGWYPEALEGLWAAQKNPVFFTVRFRTEINKSSGRIEEQLKPVITTEKKSSALRCMAP
jgi:hypothetical protein